MTAEKESEVGIACAWCKKVIALHSYWLAHVKKASLWCGSCGGETLVTIERGHSGQ